MCSALSCHNVAKHTEFYLGQLWFNVTSTLVMQGFFQKELYNGIPNVTVWRVLRKRLHLKAYKLSTVQGAEVLLN
jgi:hypothetical protein